MVWIFSLRSILLFLSFTHVATGAAYAEAVFIIGQGGEEWDVKAGQGTNISTGWLWPEKTDPSLNLAAGNETQRTGLFGRGGSVDLPNTVGLTESERRAQATVVIDGDTTTALERSGPRTNGAIIDIDLGAPFGVNLVRLFPRPGQKEKILRGYSLLVSDGLPESMGVGGRPIYTTIRDREPNERDTISVSFSDRYVRFVRIITRTSIEFEIDEIQVFGTGFTPLAIYESRPVLFDRIATFGKIEWSEFKTGDPGASRVVVRTRTGFDDTPWVYHRAVRDSVGNLVSFVPWRQNASIPKPAESLVLIDPVTGQFVEEIKAELNLDDVPAPDIRSSVAKALKIYSLLQKGLRDSLALTRVGFDRLPPSDREVKVDRENWEDWQPVINGQRISSRGERPFLQFRIELESEALDAAAGVASLFFEYSTQTAATNVIAEIAPTLGVKPGEPTEFTYALLPTIKDGDTRFGAIQIRTPAKVSYIGDPQLGPVAVSDDSARGQNKGFMTIADKEGSVRILEFETRLIEDRRFVIGFDKEAVKDSALIILKFNTVALSVGATFGADVFLDEDADARPDDLSQAVIVGNATDLSPGDADKLSVKVDFKEGSLVESFSVFPNPFTPNGDGINDIAEISYDILQIIGTAPVEVAIYDLSGRRLRTVHSSDDDSGRYFKQWDGTDDKGHLVALGIYVVQIFLETDQDTVIKTKSVAVIY